LTADMASFPLLFSPGRIGSLETKNRLVMAPLTTFAAGPEGYATDAHVNHYRVRAAGGVGLIIVEGTSINEAGHAFNANTQISIRDDRFIPGLARVARAIKENGARAAIQFHHTGIAGPKSVGPSALPNLRKGVVPHELSIEEIGELVECFGQAGRRAREAGFDAVEIHGAHGYLVSSFLSPSSNKRRDQYGGSVENRTRFGQEIIQSIHRHAGSDFPVMFRMNGADYVDGGVTVEDAMAQAPFIAGAGAAALHISASAREGGTWQWLSYLFPAGAITHLAAAVKKKVNVPVITVGKINDPGLAESLLREGKADFVALGRALFADPEWPNKVREGRLQDIRKCIYCTMCSRNTGRDDKAYPWACCSINPAMAYNWRGEDYTLRPATSPKDVLVVGGGLAGLHAAAVLAERGHRTTLYERTQHLGGQWLIASGQDYKKDSDFGRLLGQEVSRLRRSGATVVLGREVTPELARRLAPAATVVATGALPLRDIPGSDSEGVVQANDVLLGRVAVGATTAVVGGNYVGMEAALYLAERGHKVYLLTRSRVGRGVGRLVRRGLEDRLIECGVHLLPFSQVVEVGHRGVKFLTDDWFEFRFLPADSVVLATGSASQNELYLQLRESLPEVYCIGDAVAPRDAFTAIHSAEDVARKI